MSVPLSRLPGPVPGSGGPRNARATAEWILPLAEVQRWLDGAQPGEKLLYSQARRTIRGDVSALLGKMAAANEVQLNAPRSPGGQTFDYLVLRLRVAVRSEPRHSAPDPHMVQVEQQLSEFAERGERCPSDARLGALAGITPPQAKWALRKLAEAGRIESRTIAIPGNPRYRVIRVVGIDKSTALPNLVQGAPAPGGPQ